VKSTAFANERGESLVEILVSVAVIAMIFTAFLSALSTATWGVAVVRERVTAENLARKQLECIQDHPYIDKAVPISYTTTCTVTALSSYPMDLSISYWISPTFTSDPDLNDGMQWITITVYHNSDPVFAIATYKVDR
jgi:type II secretory pathway pseudopilin PulG